MNYKNLKILTVFLLSSFAAFLFGWNAILNGTNATMDESSMWAGYRVQPRHSLSDMREYDVLKYDISIKLEPGSKRIHNRVTVTLIPSRDLKNIEFDLSSDLQIESLTLNDSPGDYTHANDLVRIGSALGRGDTSEVTVVYSGDPSGKRNFFFGRINGIEVVYTLNEPENANDWLFCNDTPLDKALVNIAISADTSLVSVSLGVLDSIATDYEKGHGTYYWRSSVPVSTYLISFFSSRYATGESVYKSDISGKSLPLYIYGMPWQRSKFERILTDHKDFLSVFEKYFGEYPFPDEKYAVAAFLWQFGAMEYPTVSGFGSRLIDDYPSQQNIFLHELAHHWFGNSVSPKSWGDIWLNEGFATFCEWLYLEHLGEREKTDYLGRALISVKEPEYLKGSLQDPSDIFAARVYIKGAWVLRMLRNELGDAKFFEGLRLYYNTFKYSNASTGDLIRAFEAASGRDLAKYFDQWVFSGEGVVILKAGKPEVEKKNGKFFTTVTIEQVQSEERVYELLIDINLRGSGISKPAKVRMTEKTEVFQFELDFITETVELDPDNFLLFRMANDKKN